MNTIMKVAVTANEMAPLKKRELASDQAGRQAPKAPLTLTRTSRAH